MEKEKLLTDLHKQIEKCKRCLLFKTATHAVPGEGDPSAKIMFVGEAPGRMEDETGRPFVGRAGKLLDKLLNSIGIERKSVFITSVVKHRPPKNRAPKPNEVRACMHWLSLQLDIIKPKLIVTLGRFGMEYFMRGEKISKIHGTIKKAVVNNKEYNIFPVYHPAAALRSTRNKKALEEDFSELRKLMEKLKI